MARSRVARLRASRVPADAEINALALSPAEPLPYIYHTSEPGSSAFTFEKVMAATVDERSAVVFMMRHGLVSRTILSRHCDSEMTMDTACKRWRCRRKGCGDHEISVRAGSFFAKSKLPVSKRLRLLLFWCSDLPAGIAQQWLDISDVTAIDWYSFCRDVCSK
ncbi:hypothetical protein GN244_ATG11301 [Phytophthora infestans]|uniref:Uncharacterized protein n=1 Tax=Phytophthora infestans TaxID=4787 RepID=A0A833WBY9_PHYIN|nr:hypothetical protein GN244_ATG11301 [Phytophthora infestans]KAF4141015.1 hypothetical protein GN958_ATG09863 [Phytophthora infestans]